MGIQKNSLSVSPLNTFVLGVGLIIPKPLPIKNCSFKAFTYVVKSVDNIVMMNRDHCSYLLVCLCLLFIGLLVLL